MRQDDLALAADFPTADLAAWEGLAGKALKGAPLDRLVRRTRDGIEVRPLYGRATTADLPDHPPHLRDGTAGPGWDVRQLHAHPDPAVANRQILDDLERGATSAALRLDRALPAGGVVPDGLVAPDAADLDRALGGVYLDLAPVALEAGSAGAAALLLAVLDRRGHGAGEVGAALGIDPLGDALRGAAAEPGAAVDLAARLARHVAGHRPGLATLLADGRPWHAAGASEAQELAYALAAAVHYLRALEATGLEVGAAAGQVAFALAADADLFLTIAKLRALRLLWRRVLEASGAPGAAGSLRLHAETAARMYARRDPWVNLLRGTVACFAAAAGGADSVTVLPLDHALGPPAALSRRLARNTGLVLMEESNLHRVADPAGGGWYVESLTRELATRAWGLFREVEAGGGMIEALRAGAPQARVAATWAERAGDLATRKEPVTGVSEFPDLAEQPPPAPEPFDPGALVEDARARLGAAAWSDDVGELLALARDGRVLRAPAAESGVVPLPSHRLGEAFEALRERSDRALARDGARPRVLLANLGPAAQHAARAVFAKNLLAAGGVEAIASAPLGSAEGAADAFRASRAGGAAVCSSDEVYADLAAPAVRALKGAGCGHVYLMGRPADDALRAELTSAGVDGFVRVGQDVAAFLAGLHDRLGTPRAVLETAP